MARNRLIKREFFRDERVGALSFQARLLFQSLWIQADDSGNGRADVRLLRAEAFAFDQCSFDEVEAFLQEIVKQGMVLLYEAGGARYYSIVNFLRHQRIDHPSRFRFPAPKTLNEDSPSPQREQQEDSPPKGQRSKVNEKENGQRSTKNEKNGGKAPFDPKTVPSFDDDDLDPERPLTAEEGVRTLAVWRVVTDGRFNPNVAFAEVNHYGFKRIALTLYRRNEPKTPKQRIKFMSSVLDECVKRGIDYPPGWQKVRDDLRRALKD